MSHHIAISLDSNMAHSQSDTSSTIYSNNENNAETFGNCSEGDCSKHCLANGETYDMCNSTGRDAENKQINLNSKSLGLDLDGFKIESLVRDSDKNAKSFHKCNGILHGDYSSGDNSYVINFNSCTEELLPLVEGCNSHSHCDSLSAAAKDRHYRQSDNVDLPVEDLNLNDHVKLSDMHSSSKDNHTEIDVLLTEIEKTSLCGPAVNSKAESCVITYEVYESEKQMPDIMRLITKDLSEPYSIYTYRYFIHNWPKLCFLAMANNDCVGAIVCKLDLHKKMVRRGYIAMLAVDSEYRRRQIGSSLVTKAIEAMIRDDCDEVVLETEITNQAALHLYENLGFVRDKRLFRYYLNGVDALRLKLWLR